MSFLDELGTNDVHYKAILDYFDNSDEQLQLAAQIIGTSPRNIGNPMKLRAAVVDALADMSYEDAKELEQELGIDPHKSAEDNFNTILESLLTEDRLEVLRDKFVATNKVTDREFSKIVEADPTQAKKYVQWLLNKFIKEVKSTDDKAAYKLFFEDLYKVKDGLELFDRIKKRFSKQDINQYGIKEFSEEAFKLKQKLGAEELEKGKAKTEKYSELKLGTVEGFTVYKLPQGREDLKPVACDLGSGTNWCTAHNQSNYYNTYNRKDPLFVFIKGSEKYQYHIQSNQFMDKEDRRMEKGELRDAFEEFIERVEGRIRSNTDVSQHQLGEFEANGETYPVFKVADKFYTEIKGKKLYYDTDIHLFKYADGSGLGKRDALFHPYMDFMKYIYSKFTPEEKAKFPIVYKIFLDLDADQLKIPELGSLDLTNAQIGHLPNGLKIKGNLILTGSNITSLPDDLEVGGDLIDRNGNKIN